MEYQQNLEFIKNNYRVNTSRKKISEKLGISFKEIDDIFIDLGWKRKNITERSCPKCGNKIKHKTSNSCYASIRYKKLCKACGIINNSVGSMGDKNHFYGKEHSLEMKNKLSRERKGKHFSPDTEFKKGHKNIKEITYMESLIKKYGNNREKIEEKYNKFKNKLSDAFKGDKNPMYGKPSPQGSGNGWSGWYKGWYFRSLNELSYMVNVIERFNLKWETGESQKYKISYIDYLGNKRNYFTDFIINGKYAIECKPKKLWKADENKRKFESAMKEFLNIDIIFKIRDNKKLKHYELIDLINNGSLVFTKRYQIKFDNYGK